MGHAATSPVILKWLHANENLHVRVSDMVKDTGLTRTQVQAALMNLRVRQGLSIDTIVRGEVYCYRPGGNSFSQSYPIPKEMVPPVHTKRIFEEVGEAKGGRVIIQDVDGILWVATEL